MKLYDKPDADICKVWASDMYYAFYKQIDRRWHLFGDFDLATINKLRGRSANAITLADVAQYLRSLMLISTHELAMDLPPGPWRPCHIVGEEPDSAPRMTPEEQAVLDAAKAYLSNYDGSRWERFKDSIRALIASERPKVCDHCGQELPSE